MSSSPETSVVIGNESFSMVEIPRSDTALVLDQKEQLLGGVSLPALVYDLGRVGNCVRIAYNGVAVAAGCINDLQISIREIGVDVTQLCDKSAVAVSKFKTASGCILADIQRTYQFLLDGREGIALITLAAAADVAKDMALTANELALQKDFFQEAVKVEETLLKLKYKEVYSKLESQMAIDALHHAIGGLQILFAVMRNAARFWEQMQIHCETLTKDKMKKMIERGMKCPEAQRLHVWTSCCFKKRAIEYYGRWVAFDDVCTIYMQRIQEIRKDLYKYLTENPTTEQARRNVRELAATFAKDLAKEQKAIIERIEKDHQMMRKLRQEIEEHKDV